MAKATKKAWQMTHREWLGAGKPDHGILRRRPTFGARAYPELAG